MQSAYLVTRSLCALKPQKPGPPPTCPFIKHHNVKEPTDKKPDTQRSPIFLPEEGVSCYVGDQTAEAFASRPVKGPLKGSYDSVNRVFAILFQNFCGTPENHVFVSNYR